jgi:hypothetical protein
MAKSIVGDLIGKRNIVYAPINRAGVLVMFARLLDEFDMLLEETSPDGDYVIVRRRVDTGWERVKVGLAYKSSEFNDFDIDDGDLLICWNHDWPECPVTPFELRSLFESEYQQSRGPGTETTEGKKGETQNASLENIMPENPGKLLKNRNITRQRFDKAISDLDDKIKNFFPDKT